MATSTIRAQEIILCHLCGTRPTKLHCNPCQTDLCENCVGKHTMMSSFAAHEIINVSVDEKKRLVEKDTSYLQDVISKFKKADEEIDCKMVALNTRCDELEELILKHGKEWHCVIDNVMMKNKREIARIREDGTNELRKYKTEMKDVFLNLQETVQRNKEIVKSVDVNEICQYELASSKYQNTPLNVELKLPTFVFKEVLRIALEIAEFPTGITPLKREICVGSDEAWISGNDETVTRFNIKGAVLEKVNTTCSGSPSDITVSKEGNLIYTDTANKVVNIVQQGKSTTLITAPQGWEPLGVFCSQSGDLLVSMRTTDQTRCKIVRYEGKRITQEIEEDDMGDPLYKGGSKMLFVAEDDNGDICASDCNANAFIMVNRAGELLYRYTERQMKGNPCGIMIFSVFRIFLGFWGKSAYFIYEYGRRRFCSGLGYYGAHSIDRFGRLWLGESSSGKVKIINDERMLCLYYVLLIGIIISLFINF
ncbi:uncharacterized protein LOC133204593 [Saccostrea echinata]|uniref:uncharacterized protein LOC133204593 n=1 Tax=Saccostrea echinata TaxID=191078 RepID=UPI002A8282F3|nr:uncharacterized protein LOC133204593 [Saccostrea echinata]